MAVFCLKSLIYSVVLITVAEAEITEYEVLKHMFTDDSKALLTRPPGINGSYSAPVRVNFSAYIYRIDKLDERNMELELYLYYRTSWHDSRLSENYHNFVWSSESYLKHIILPEQYKIWTPDIIFEFVSANEKCGERLPYSATLVFPNGTVEYARSGPLTVKCPMNLKKYPFDTQACFMKIVTAGSNKKEVSLQWREYEPLTFAKISNSLYTFIAYQTDVVDHRAVTGEPGGIKVSLFFSRNFQYYFIKFYLPVLITAFISWIPFRLNDTSIVRVGLALSTLLFTSWYYMTRPDELLVPYTTYLDVWRTVNFLFVFLAAIESFFVVNTLKYDTTKGYLNCSAEKIDQADVEVEKVKPNFKIFFIGVPKRIEDLDRKCNVWFPCAYLIFIFLYWIGFFLWD